LALRLKHLPAYIPLQAVQKALYKLSKSAGATDYFNTKETGVHQYG